MFSFGATQETVCIATTMAELCNLKVKAADFVNAHVATLHREKIWMVLGYKLGDGTSKTTICLVFIWLTKLVHQVACMWELNCQYFYANGDLWVEPKTRPDDDRVLFVHFSLCQEQSVYQL